MDGGAVQQPPIDLIRYSDLEKLGEGSFGVVFKARDMRTDETVALKRLIWEVSETGISAGTLREISILKALKHPNIIELKDVVLEPKIMLVFEYLPHDLFRLLRSLRHSEECLGPETVRLFSYQLLCGICYLHIHSVIHRDITSSNVLCLEDGRVKICDFGLARTVSIPLRNYSPVVVTLFYKAPELLLENEFYEYGIDVWAAGCVIAEMCRGRYLFEGDCSIAVANCVFRILGTPDDEVLAQFPKIANAKIQKHPGMKMEAILQTEDSNLVDLVLKMLEIDPRKRISAREALKHPYFKEVPGEVKQECYPHVPRCHGILDDDGCSSKENATCV
jgi:serine/threonine protein kinase